MPDTPDVQLREQLRLERARVRGLRGVVESQAQQLDARAQLIRVQGLRIEALERCCAAVRPGALGCGGCW